MCCVERYVFRLYYNSLATMAKEDPTGLNFVSLLTVHEIRHDTHDSYPSLIFALIL